MAKIDTTKVYKVYNSKTQRWLGSNGWVKHESMSKAYSSIGRVMQTRVAFMLNDPYVTVIEYNLREVDRTPAILLSDLSKANPVNIAEAMRIKKGL